MIIFVSISEMIETFVHTIVEILNMAVSIFTEVFNTYPFWFFLIIGMLIVLLIIDVIKLIRNYIKKSDKKDI